MHQGTSMRSAFDRSVDLALAALRPGEDVTLWYAAERGSFCRFNHGRVRQVGDVDQAELRVRLIVGRRHASATIDLSGGSDDAQRIEAAVERLRGLVGQLPDDPYLLWHEAGGLLLDDDTDAPEPDARAAVALVAAAAGDTDLVGILASGYIARGFASSRGSRCWQCRTNVHFDFSLYLRGDKAVKASVAGPDWQSVDLVGAFADARARLALLALPEVQLPRGAYRVWMEPAALSEILGLMAWEGFSGAALQARSSPLLRLAEGASLDPRVTIVEAHDEGLAPRFSEDGFLRPERTVLVQAGRHHASLVAPRTAAEHGLPMTGSAEDEGPESMSMSPGDIPSAEALARIGDGVWIGNLWYLNWSDRAAGRMTGMTRFATFAVRGGEIAGPMSVMRFDDSLYRMLGTGLVGLGDHAQLLPDAGTYGRRSTVSVRCPGALIDDFSFTL